MSLDRVARIKSVLEGVLDVLEEDARLYQGLRDHLEFLGWDNDFRPDEVDCEVDKAMKGEE